MPDYTFDPATGLWRHRAGPVEPPLRLTDVTYDASSGAMTYARHDTTAPSSVLADYMREARRIMADAEPPDCSDQAHLSEDFDTLRWFELPAGTLAD